MDSEMQATFIVRLRRERGTPAGEWRGEVEHIQSGVLARFADQEALLALVWSQVAEAELQPPPPADGSGGVAEAQKEERDEECSDSRARAAAKIGDGDPRTSSYRAVAHLG